MPLPTNHFVIDCTRRCNATLNATLQCIYLGNRVGRLFLLVHLTLSNASYSGSPGAGLWLCFCTLINHSNIRVKEHLFILELAVLKRFSDLKWLEKHLSLYSGSHPVLSDKAPL